MSQAAAIVDDVRQRGEPALLEHALRLGDIRPGERLIYDRKHMEASLKSLPLANQKLIFRTADRIRAFAEAQYRCFRDFSLDIEGGQAGHFIEPMERAGCYAPGGRYPLPSSVLMTATPAKVAGVENIWVASPRPTPVTLAACLASGADSLLAVGGAQAIAAMAFGAGRIPPCDVIVGPGNKYVTAAKKIVAGYVKIDMPAGPSELIVFADEKADPALIAADLLAQAEHDPDSLPVLVALNKSTISEAEKEMERQLLSLPSHKVARAALKNGFAVLAPDLDTVIAVCNRLAPEHLEVLTDNAWKIRKRFKYYGALFIGSKSAQVLGDYGAGPNHVLPTGGAARFSGGLSVIHFLRFPTWLHIDKPANARKLFHETAQMARLEGLEGHSRAAELRLLSKK